MAGMRIPPGFRFHPTDIELVMYYLKRKVTGKNFLFKAISEINIYKFSPWDLPDKSCLRSKDLEWYFFCPREKKYASGARTNRATESGYWKTTGKDRPVVHNENTVGTIKTLVFHLGHAPRGQRTDWVMHEYRMEDKYLVDAGVLQDTYVLCKVFQKTGPGPKNGAQYGAPFNEEEWDVETCSESIPTDGLLADALGLPNKHSGSAVTSMSVPGSTCSWPFFEAGPSTAMPSTNNVPSVMPDDVDVVPLLDMFTDDDALLSLENANNENFDNLHHGKNIAVSCSNGENIFGGSGDLDNLEGVSKEGFGLSNIQKADYHSNSMLQSDDTTFLELDDLESPLTCPAGTTGSEQLLTDSLYTPYSCYNNLEHFTYGGDFSSEVPHVFGLHNSPLLAEGFDGPYTNFDVIQSNVTGDCARERYNITSYTGLFCTQTTGDR